MRRMVSQEKLSVLDFLKKTSDGVAVKGDLSVDGDFEVSNATITALALESLEDVNGETGSDGQILMSDGETCYWGDLSLSANSINFANLPTSDPQVVGKLWNDNGTLKVSTGE